MKTNQFLIICLLNLMGFSACEKEATELTNEEKVRAVLEALETGDMNALVYIDDDYKEHNLSRVDGKAALGTQIRGSASGVEVTTHRIFADGAYVITHNSYGGNWNNNVPQVGFDVFRLENGLIVEHWDNLQNDLDDGDYTTLTNGVTEIAGDGTETTRQLISTAMKETFVQGQWNQMYTYWDTTNYVQHSYGLGVDIHPLLGLIATLPSGTPFYKSIKYVFANGDFGLVLSEGFPDATTGRSTAYYDLFRVENNQIVEHWDILQEIPDQAVWINNNGKW